MATSGSPDSDGQKKDVVKIVDLGRYGITKAALFSTKRLKDKYRGPANEA